MNRKTAILLGIIILLAACQAGGPASGATDDSNNPLAHLPPEVREGLERYFFEMVNRGLMNCEGYLTNIESQGYCSSELPNDWTSFEYDNETYYYRPLANASN